MQRITYFIPSGFSGRLILFADSSANENYALDVFVVNSRWIKGSLQHYTIL